MAAFASGTRTAGPSPQQAADRTLEATLTVKYTPFAHLVQVKDVSPGGVQHQTPSGVLE